MTTPSRLLSADREREDAVYDALRVTDWTGDMDRMAATFWKALTAQGFTVAALSSPETNPAGVLDEAALREALEICVTELRRRERAAGKVISSPAVIFARSRLDGLRTTPEIEAAARSVLLAAAFGRSGSET